MIVCSKFENEMKFLLLLCYLFYDFYCYFCCFYHIYIYIYNDSINQL